MTWTPRRVVTGHDKTGNSVFLSDGIPPVMRQAPDGAEFIELWNTSTTPARITPEEPDPTETSLSVPPPPNGTKIRINVLPPGTISPMHRTQTIDYGVVLAGEVTLVLTDSETTLHPGDVAIQRGTDHRWENRTNTETRIAFILVDAAFTEDLKSTLGEAADDLLHDPMNSAR